MPDHTYLARPPLPDRPPATLRLARIERRTFDRGGPYDPEDGRYFTDLLTSYGMKLRAGALDEGRNSFRDMVAGLLPRLRPYHDRFDLAILAHVTPDAEPGWPMCYLTDAVARPGLAFAISDQGLVAAFTALRIALDGVLPHTDGRAQVWVIDQCARLHDGPVPDRLRATRDSAVALVLDRDGGLGHLSVGQRTGVAPGAAADRLGTVLAAGDGRATTTVLGAGLAPHVPGDGLDGRVVRPAPGTPGTGVWSALADELGRAGGATPHRYLVADYDEDLGHLGIGVLLVPGPTGREATT
nr:hypothetical protein [Micromonospora sp. DSM 115978]